MEKANPEVGKVKHTEKRRERSLGLKDHKKLEKINPLGRNKYNTHTNFL